MEPSVLGGAAGSDFSGGGVPPAPDGDVESPFLPDGGSIDFGPEPTSPCFAAGTPSPGLIFFNALPASSNNVPAFFNNGINAFIAFTKRPVTFAMSDAVFATAEITSGTTHAKPIPNVNTTCNAQLIKCPTSCAIVSRTNVRTAPTTSPAVFTPLDAPSQPFAAACNNATASADCARYASPASPTHDDVSAATIDFKSSPTLPNSVAMFFHVSEFAAI
ncbi:hypothetical protein [Amycolatopsis sp.]|uniref:hypothetical protein n=1 Tax=Amycolatopsis sp. TaxID=37632 RepID=UPI002615F144|nr:hypothetical protein [Amycolatopsis sp.]